MFYTGATSSTRPWGRGHGRRRPTRGVGESQMDLDGQRWNVQLIWEYSVGQTGVSFATHMSVVAKTHYKIWQKKFTQLPVATKEAIFRDLQVIIV